MSELLNKVTIARESYIDENDKIHYVDYGNVIIINGEVFERDSITLMSPSYSMQNNDMTNISGIVFDFDDNGVLSGDCHREWSDIEVAIASLPQYNSHYWGHPNIGMNNITIDMCDQNLTWTIPESGILRINHVTLASTAKTFPVFINGRLRTHFFSKINTSPITIQMANSLIVNKNDVISIPNMYTRVMLLPFKYNVD